MPACTACRGGATGCSGGRCRTRRSRRSSSASSTCSRPRTATPTCCATCASTSTAADVPAGARPGRRPRRPRARRRRDRRPRIARRNIRRMAEQFIVGTSRRRRRPPACTGCGEQGTGFVVDLLGEKTVTEAEADRYAAAGRRAGRPPCSSRSATGRPTTTSSATTSGPLPRVQVSIKPTALAPLFAPAHPRRRPGPGQGAAAPDPATGGRARRVRVVRHGALRRQGPHPAAVPRAARRARAGRAATPACVIQAYLKDSRTTWPT